MNQKRSDDGLRCLTPEQCADGWPCMVRGGCRDATVGHCDRCNRPLPHTDAEARICRSLTYTVEKQGYSRGKWRVLDGNGEQVYRNEAFEHPNLGLILIEGPVCFDRKRDALAWIESHTTPVAAASGVLG